MATGADKGLLEELTRQSTFKHAIIGQYLPRFIQITGSRAPSISLVDGYAGSGHQGGEAGSSGLMLEAAVRAGKEVATRVFLIESDRSRFARLEALAASFNARGVRVESRKNLIEHELESILAITTGDALFLLLDPCGALQDFDSLSAVFTKWRPHTWPPTDVVLNFSAVLTRRAAGQLIKGSADQQAVCKLDRVAGGDWWHAVARRLAPRSGDDTFEAIANAVATEYGKRLAAQAGTRHLVVPVFKREGRQPIYHLVFLSRKPHGIAHFADSVGRARPAWLAAIYGTDPDLFSASGEEPLGQQAAKARASDEQVQTVPVIAGNLRAIAASHRDFVPLDHIEQVYGSELGLATDTQVAQALARLVKEGALAVVNSHSKPIQRTYRAIG